MRKIIYALLAVSAVAAVSTSSAEAWGGCGPYGHPTPWGCRPNHHRYWGGPVFFAPVYGWHRPYWHHHWRRW